MRQLRSLGPIARHTESLQIDHSISATKCYRKDVIELEWPLAGTTSLIPTAPTVSSVHQEPGPLADGLSDCVEPLATREGNDVPHWIGSLSGPVGPGHASCVASSSTVADVPGQAIGQPDGNSPARPQRHSDEDIEDDPHPELHGATPNG